jgi:multidrug efflux pump subunit AcrB
LHWGGVSWNIYGVGQGFTNTGDEQIAGFRVAMYGYNFDELEKQAGKLAIKLAGNNRVQKINTNDLLKFGEKKSDEYVLNLDDKKMAYFGVDKPGIVEQLTALSKPVSPAGYIIFENQYYPVYIKDRQADYFSVHQALNVPVPVDSAKSIRIGNIGMLEKRNTLNSIRKENRQYIRVVSFEYMGSSEFGEKFLTKSLEEMKTEMPVGFSASQLSRKWNWWKSNREYSLVAILLLSIFFICGVLFENLKQPFHIITIIPVSFIGLFLTFAWGGYYFDQGGYAAFVMLGGLVANAAIFIVNDFNILRKNKPGHLYNRLLIKATAGRARTVFLTTISTCCGLIPFLLEGQNEVFWFSLAAGTIGGLLFSLFALFIVLPVLLWKKKIKTRR